MAGSKIKDEFKELISPFLQHKMEELKKTYGVESHEFQAVSRQYISDPFKKILLSP